MFSDAEKLQLQEIEHQNIADQSYSSKSYYKLE